MVSQIIDIPRTAMEVFNLLPEGTRCEVIDNTLYMSPSPTFGHQDLLLDIATEIRQFLKKQPLGIVCVSPFDVYLDDETNVIQPDIMFIKTDNLHIIKNRGIYGTPDMVMELLSSNKSYDKKKKFELYERNGIPEYIIIDPETKEVWQYLFTDSKYQLNPNKNGLLTFQSLNLEISF